MRLRKEEETSFGEVFFFLYVCAKKDWKVMLEPKSGRNLKDEEWCEVYTRELKLFQSTEGDTTGAFEVLLLYFLTCMLVTWRCSVCENSPNCVLTVYELFCMYIICQLKVRNISVKRTQIRKTHQGLIHHIQPFTAQKIHREVENIITQGDFRNSNNDSLPSLRH